MGRKRRREQHCSVEENNASPSAKKVEGCSTVSNVLNGAEAPEAVVLAPSGSESSGVIVVLRNTELIVDRQKGVHPKLIHADTFARRKDDKKEPVYRPDLVHQSLMMLLDSPLNKTGRLTIFMENVDKKIIWVSSAFRIPRSWKVFSKVMCDFLTNPKGILTPPGDSDTVLMKLREPPLMNYVKDMKRVVLGSGKGGGRFCRLRDHLSRLLPGEASAAFIIELPSSRPLQSIPVDHRLALSTYPTAASVLCNRLCNELELHFGV